MLLHSQSARFAVRHVACIVSCPVTCECRVVESAGGAASATACRIGLSAVRTRSPRPRPDLKTLDLESRVTARSTTRPIFVKVLGYTRTATGSPSPRPTGCAPVSGIRVSRARDQVTSLRAAGGTFELWLPLGPRRPRGAAREARRFSYPLFVTLELFVRITPSRPSRRVTAV